LLSACALFRGESSDPSHPCWLSKQPGVSRTRPAALGGAVFFADGTGRVLAHDASTGVVQWSTLVDTGGAVAGANLLVGNDVLVVPSAFQTFGLNPQTGKQLWSYEAPIDSLLSPLRPGFVAGVRVAIDRGIVYVPAWGGSLSAVDLKT